MRTMSKWQLFSLLATADTLAGHFKASNGNVYFGLLQSVQREDGTGSSFNITVANQSGSVTFHVRTTD